MAGRVGRDGFRRAHANHLTAASAAFRTHVDDPVGGLDDVQVVFDHHDGVTGVAQVLQHRQQQRNVGEMQAGGGLVQDVERASGIAFGQFERQLDALRFAA